MKTSFMVAGFALLPFSVALAAACNGSGSTGSTGTGQTGATSSGNGGAGASTSTSMSASTSMSTASSMSTSGTATGSGATTSSATAASSGSGGTQPCPPGEPVAGTACPGATIVPCQFKPYACCQDDVATCNGSGMWDVAQGSCPAATCPAAVPTNGDACGCPQATFCVYPGNCPTAGAQQHFAFCQMGQWKVSAAGCPGNPQPIQCGSVTCDPATQVCVRVGVGPNSMAVGCKPIPCPVNAFDCTCARTVCPMDHPICKATDGPFVNCQ